MKSCTVKSCLSLSMATTVAGALRATYRPPLLHQGHQLEFLLPCLAVIPKTRARVSLNNVSASRKLQTASEQSKQQDPSPRRPLSTEQRKFLDSAVRTLFLTLDCFDLLMSPIVTCESSGRACGDTHLYPSNPTNPTHTSPPPAPDGSHVRPRGWPFLHV